MSAYELFNTRDGETDKSKSRRTRVFRVDKPQDIALTDEQLPRMGSVYPTAEPHAPFPLILDRYEVETMGDGSNTLVRCIYTNDRSGRLAPHPDTTKPNFQTSAVSFQDGQAEIPTVLTYPLKVPGATGTTTTRVGETVIYKLEQTNVVFEISVVVQGFINAEQWHLIEAQNNHLHKIRGKYYKFRAGEIRQTEKEAWETSYHWLSDNGTPKPARQLFGTGSYTPIVQIPPTTSERTLYLPPANRNILELLDPTFTDPVPWYIRSPFHAVTFTLDASAVPIWDQFPMFAGLGNNGSLVGQGWRTLPPGNLNL